jgi:phytanoyl-CoA hydroxylase
MTQLTDISDYFNKNGYAHLPNFISSKDCEHLILRMRELTERNCQNDRLHCFETGDQQTGDEFFLSSASKISFFFDKNALNEKNLKSNFHALNKVGHALHKLCPLYRKFSHQERFYTLLKSLGLQKPLLVQSMFIFKQPQFGDEVPMHQDSSFLYTEPNSVLGFWFALEDANEENGCLWVLPGGHQGKLKNRFYKSKNTLGFREAQHVDWPKKAFRPLPAKRGDMIILHGFIPHFSEKNKSNISRYAYTLHFIDKKSYYPKSNWLDISHN